MIALALLVQKDTLLHMTHNQMGIIYGGSVHFLLVQLLSTFVIGLWSALSTAIILYSIRLVINIRLDINEELRGADFTEHNTSFEANDDSLLPQNSSLKTTTKSIARMRLKKVLNALRATHRFSTYSRRHSFLKRQVKENQAKTLAMSWPTDVSPGGYG